MACSGPSYDPEAFGYFCCTAGAYWSQPDEDIYRATSENDLVESYWKFVLVAFASILVGIPLWTAVLAPDEFSPMFMIDPGFWVTVAIGMSLLLFGFWLGNRTDLA